jgi:hypothetical protein
MLVRVGQRVHCPICHMTGSLKMRHFQHLRNLKSGQGKEPDMGLFFPSNIKNLTCMLGELLTVLHFPKDLYRAQRCNFSQSHDIMFKA